MARPSAATLIREGEHLAALASETVERLMTRQPVGEVPECAPGWDQACIGAVREVKNRYRNGERSVCRARGTGWQRVQ